jgi:cell division septation protein DedD
MTRSFPFPPRARLLLGACAVLALGACTETFQPFGNVGTRNATNDGPAPLGATRLVERDIEAPDVFEVTEDGLWDGRPSLGGVWVAHPTAEDPERVIIRNEENGRFVIGALFRRERDHPGPELMVSSDAAAALNILAGDPTLLQVTALRREEVPDPVIAPTVEPPSAEATLAAVEPAAITATSLADPIAAAEAAIAESEIAAETARSANRGAAEELAAAQGDMSAPASPRPTTAPAPAPSAAAASTAASTLERPFVQIGIFSVQENANNTGQALRNAGLVPTIYDQSSNGGRFWRVVVGPARTSDDRAAILEPVRGLGFGAAYFVTR